MTEPIRITTGLVQLAVAHCAWNSLDHYSFASNRVFWWTGSIRQDADQPNSASATIDQWTTLPRNESTTAKRRGLSPTALYSLISAMFVAMLLLGGWYYFRAEKVAAVAIQRKVTDRLMTWQCREGHEFELPRRPSNPVRCATCDEFASMKTQYHCRLHGNMDALIRIALNEDGTEQLTRSAFAPVFGAPSATQSNAPTAERS